MDTNPIRPPDMQGAGVSPSPYPAGEAVGLLKSQGSMPSAALQGLATPPVPPIPTGGYAGAISAGMPYVGLPDVVARQNQQAGAAMGQQFQQMAQIRQMKVADMERKYRQQQDYLKIGQEFLQSDNEAARGFGTQVIGGALKNMGIQVPQNVLVGIGQRHISGKDADDIVTRLVQGYTPQQILAVYPNVTPGQLQEFVGMAKDPNPALTKAIFGKTPDEMRATALSNQEKELDAWAKNHGIEQGSDLHAEMLRISRGKPIGAMTDDEVSALRATAEKTLADKTLKQSLDKIREEESIKHRNRMAEIQERAALDRLKPAQNPEMRTQVVKLQTDYQNLTRPDDRVSRLRDAVALLSKEDLLPTGPTAADFAIAYAKGGTKLGRSDIAAAWETLQRYGVPLMVDAERQLAGMPIGSILRLKSVAEAEVGGIRRIPAQWWRDFFQDYESGKKIRSETLKAQLEAMGVEARPSAGPLNPPGGKALTADQYQKIRAKGYTDDEIRAKGWEVPR